MTDDMIALARRAVACKGWRWMPGMLTEQGRVVEVDAFKLLVGYCIGQKLKNGSRAWPAGWECSASLRTPDLTDSATVGLLLQLVRDAYDDPGLYARMSDKTRRSDGARAWEVWVWLDAERSPDGQGGPFRAFKAAGAASEADALVDALEGAP